MIRNLAVACCFALMAFGAALIVLDARAAVTLSAAEWTRTMAHSLALWRWGVACVMAGVLGMVGLALINAMVTARLWLAREQRKEGEP
jgi:hypothetical protein